MWVIPEDLGNISPKKEEKSREAKIHMSFSVEFSNKINKIVLYLLFLLIRWLAIKKNLGTYFNVALTLFCFLGFQYRAYLVLL